MSKQMRSVRDYLTSSRPAVGTPLYTPAPPLKRRLKRRVRREIGKLGALSTLSTMEIRLDDPDISKTEATAIYIKASELGKLMDLLDDPHLTLGEAAKLRMEIKALLNMP